MIAREQRLLGIIDVNVAVNQLKTGVQKQDTQASEEKRIRHMDRHTALKTTFYISTSLLNNGTVHGYLMSHEDKAP